MRQVKARSGAQEGEVVEIKFGRRNQSVTNVRWQLVMPSEQLQQSFTTQLNSTHTLVPGDVFKRRMLCCQLFIFTLKQPAFHETK